MYRLLNDDLEVKYLHYIKGYHVQKRKSFVGHTVFSDHLLFYIVASQLFRYLTVNQ